MCCKDSEGVVDVSTPLSGNDWGTSLPKREPRGLSERCVVEEEEGGYRGLIRGPTFAADEDELALFRLPGTYIPEAGDESDRVGARGLRCGEVSIPPSRRGSGEVAG